MIDHIGLNVPDLGAAKSYYNVMMPSLGYEPFFSNDEQFSQQLVYLAFSRDETLMGFAFPKEEREALVESEPDKFLMPKPSDQRYNWVVVRLDSIDEDEMREIVQEAWRMVVPKKVAADHLGR